MYHALSLRPYYLYKHRKGGSLRPTFYCVFDLLTGAGSVAELCSALRSAAGENLAAVRGSHSLAEAVLLLALMLLGLVGTKHFLALLSGQKYSTSREKSGK